MQAEPPPQAISMRASQIIARSNTYKLAYTPYVGADIVSFYTFSEISDVNSSTAFEIRDLRIQALVKTSVAGNTKPKPWDDP